MLPYFLGKMRLAGWKLNSFLIEKDKRPLCKNPFLSAGNPAEVKPSQITIDEITWYAEPCCLLWNITYLQLRWRKRVSIKHISVLQSGIISNKINSWGAWQGPKAHAERETVSVAWDIPACTAKPRLRRALLSWVTRWQVPSQLCCVTGNTEIKQKQVWH